MKVYVVLDWWDYENCSVELITASKEEAETFIKDKPRHEIQEYDWKYLRGLMFMDGRQLMMPWDEKMERLKQIGQTHGFTSKEYFDALEAESR